MKKLLVILAALALFTPLLASAFGTSFGGRVLAVTPCAAKPGFLQVLIQPAGLFLPLFVWGPGTLGLPPLHPGQYILGLADLFVPGVPIPLVDCGGQRIQRDGVGI